MVLPLQYLAANSRHPGALRTCQLPPLFCASLSTGRRDLSVEVCLMWHSPSPDTLSSPLCPLSVAFPVFS